MIVQEKKKAIKKPVLRFKMYKSGKQMINASFIGLSMVGVMTVTSTINADANTNTPATVSQTSQASTTATPSSGSNTVTNQVTVNSSTLDNAVSAAKSAGLPVNTKPATSQTVQESQVPVARQQIESDYQSQAAKINSTVAEYNHAKSNYSTYNGAKGDNSALNAAVSNASTIPGLSVVKDSDHPTTSVSASSDDAIASAAIQSDYANQIKQISDAIATQKQKYQEWKANYDKQIAGIDPSHAVKTDQIYVPSQLDFTNSDVDVSINQPYSTDTLWHGSLWDNSYNSKHQYLIKNPQNGLTITWHNAAIEKSTGRKLNITWTITDIVNVPKGDPSNWTSDLIKRQAEQGWAAPTQESQDADALNTITVYSNPIDEIGWANIAGFKVKETLSYSDDGSDYQGIYYHSAGSLNAQNTGDRWEFAAPISGVLGSFISPDSLILPEEQSVSGKATSVTDKAFMIGPNKEYGSGMGGCFWCMVEPFDTYPGIKSVVSGYTGGHVPNPTYEQVCSGKTGHTEAVKITFDPDVISYDDLVTIYWHQTDPTDAMGQFQDRGDNYRPVIFVNSPQQREIAEKSKAALQASGQFGNDKIVTQIEDAKPFYPAEDYHQDFYKKDPQRYALEEAGGRAQFKREHWNNEK